MADRVCSNFANSASSRTQDMTGLTLSDRPSRLHRYPRKRGPQLHLSIPSMYSPACFFIIGKTQFNILPPTLLYGVRSCGGGLLLPLIDRILPRIRLFVVEVLDEFVVPASEQRAHRRTEPVDVVVVREVARDDGWAEGPGGIEGATCEVDAYFC